jgi:hypothetical protein
MWPPFLTMQAETTTLLFTEVPVPRLPRNWKNQAIGDFEHKTPCLLCYLWPILHCQKTNTEQILLKSLLP